MPPGNIPESINEQPEAIYTMVKIQDWIEAERLGIYKGSADDKRDGFLHFSTAAQIPVSAEKHRKGQKELVLVAVRASDLGADLVWEPSRDQALFPHLYADLRLDKIAWVKPLPLKEGSLEHDFPDLDIETI